MSACLSPVLHSRDVLSVRYIHNPLLHVGTPAPPWQPQPSLWVTTELSRNRQMERNTSGQILGHCKCSSACTQRTAHCILTGFTLWVAASSLSSLLVLCIQMHGGALSLFTCRMKQLQLRMLLKSVSSIGHFYIGTLPCNKQSLVQIHTEFEVNILQVSATEEL